MTWGAVAGATIGAVGSVAAARSASKGQTTTSDPWSGQQPYLSYGFSEAQRAYQDAKAMGTYQGQRVADLNPYSTQAADFAGQYGQQYGMPAAQALGAAGQQFLGSGSQFSGNAADLYSRAAGGNATQTILNNAAQYANSPYADSMITAANRDVQRQLTEQALPSLARSASGTGNTNSSRAGVEQAIAERGASDRMADTAANIRSTLFSNGLQQSQQQYNQDMSNSLAANNQLLQSFQQGGNTILQGQQVSGNVYDQSTAAGSLYQTQNQAQLNAAQQAWTDQQQNQLNLLGQYSGLVNGNYGGTTTSSGTPYSALGSALQGGLGGAALGYGLTGKLGGYNQSNVTPGTNYSLNTASNNTSGSLFGGSSGSTGSFWGSNVKFGG